MSEYFIDNEVEEFLCSCGLQKYLANFVREEVSFENLLHFDLALIERLIPKLGPLQTFLTKRNQVLSKRRTLLEESKFLVVSTTVRLSDVENAIPSTSAITSSIAKIMSAPTSRSKITEDASSITDTSLLESKMSKRRRVINFVTKALDGTSDGKDLYKRYEGPNGFATFDRVKLSEILIKRELNGDTEARISRKRFEEIVKDILNVFPSEIPSTWYIPAGNVNGKQVYPRGVLYNKYVTIGRKYRASGSRNGTRLPKDIITVPVQST